MKWKDFFYFSKTERQAVIVLIALIMAICAASWFLPLQHTEIVASDKAFEEEYAAFLASVQKRRQERNFRQANRFQPRKVVLAPFDPNTTDSVGLLDLGLPPWMAHNILRYRAKGGTFRTPESFKKVYGLTEEQYATLLPYLSINESYSRRDTLRLYTARPAKDSLLTFKYPAGTVVSLNQADTTELKKIPGVGSRIARMIVGYRNQLGGFYRIEQLAELRLTVEMLHPWLSVGKDETRRINLNKASIERLRAHPYINFYQAKAIVEYRKKRGKLNNIQQLKLYEEFTALDLERIAPYVCFD